MAYALSKIYKEENIWLCKSNLSPVIIFWCFLVDLLSTVVDLQSKKIETTPTKIALFKTGTTIFFEIQKRCEISKTCFRIGDVTLTLKFEQNDVTFLTIQDIISKKMAVCEQSNNSIK